MSDQSDFEDQYRQEIADAIVQDPSILVQGLEVTGDGQMVELWGTVQSYEARQAAEEHAWTYPGVTMVRNNLNVLGEDEGPLDEEAEDSIRDLLSQNIDTKLEGLDITFDAGMITIEGTVDTDWKRQRIADLILDIPTVTDFLLRVAVVPHPTETDTELTMNVLRELESNERVDINTIIVTVRDRIVTLSGVVPSYQTRTTAYDTVVRIPGVREVRDEMEVETEF